jgi:hypothetical protein
MLSPISKIARVKKAEVVVQVIELLPNKHKPQYHTHTPQNQMYKFQHWNQAEEEEPFLILGSGEVATGTIQGLLSEGVLNELTSY